MADGRKVQYLIELLPDTKQFEKIRDKMKAIDGGEFIKFEPSEVKKLKGILQGVVDDVGNRASSIGEKIQKGIASGIDKDKLQKMLDLDTSKLRETMEIVEKLTGLIDDHSKGSSWLKDGKGFLGKLSGSQQELRSLEQSIGQLELKFEGLDASLTSTIAKFDALATAIRSLQDNGKPIVVSPINITTDTKQVQQFEKEITDLNALLTKLSSKDVKINTDNVAKDFHNLAREADKLSEKIDDLIYKADSPNISKDDERNLRMQIANRQAKLAQMYREMDAMNQHYQKSRSDTSVSLFDDAGVLEDPKDIVKQAKEYIASVIKELSVVTESEAKKSDNAIGVEIALPSVDDIKKKLNNVIDQLNKPNSLHKVKLEIDDVANIIEDANKRAYGDSPADDDAKTTELVQKTENRLDRVAQVIKGKQDAIFDRTNDWRKKMINAMSINAKDLEFQFGLESNMENTADALFNKLQEYFERPEYALDIKFNTEKIARDLKAGLEAEGIELGVGGGAVNIDANSLMSMLHSLLYGGMPAHTTAQTGGTSGNSTQKEVADETKEATDSGKEYIKVLDETTLHIDKVIESLRAFAKEANKANASKGSKAVASRLTNMGIDIGAIKNGAKDTDIIKMLQTALMSKDKMGKAQGASLVGKLEGMMQTYGMDSKKGSGKVVDALTKDIMELFDINELETELEEELVRRFEQLEIWKGIEKPGKALAALGNVRSTKKKVRTPAMEQIDEAIKYFEMAEEDTAPLKKLKEARQKFEDNGQTEEAQDEFEKAALVFYDETKDVFNRLKDRWGDFKGVVQAEGRRPVNIDPKGAYPSRILEIPDDAVIAKVDIFEVFKTIRDIGFTGSSARRESSQKKAEFEQQRVTYDPHTPNYIVKKPTPKKDVRYEEIEYDTFKTQESKRLPQEVALDATIESLEKHAAEIPELVERIEESKKNIAQLEEIKQQIKGEITNLQVQDLPEFQMSAFDQYSKRDLSVTAILKDAKSALATNGALDAVDVSKLDKDQKSLVNRLQILTTNIHNDSVASQELANKIAEIVEAKKLSKEELEIARSKAAERGDQTRVDFYRDLLFNRDSVDSRLDLYQSQKSSVDKNIGDNKNRAQKLITELKASQGQSANKATKEAETLATQLIEAKERLYAEAKTYANILNDSSADDKTRETALGQLQETLRGLNQITGKFATIQAYVPQTHLYNSSQQNNVDKWNKNYTNKEVRKLEEELKELEKQLETEEDEAKIAELKKKIANTKRNLTRLKKSVPDNIRGKKQNELGNIERQLSEERSKLTVDENQKRVADRATSDLQSTKQDATFLTKYNELLEKEKSLLEEVNKLKREGADKSVIEGKTAELKQTTKTLDDFLKKEKTAERTAYARKQAVEYQAQLHTAYRKRSVFDNQIQGLDDDEANLTKYGLSGRVGSRARRRALSKATSEYMSSDDVRAQEEAIRKNEQLSWEQRDKQLKELRQKLREEFAKRFDDTNVQQDELDRIAAERAIAEAGREPLDDIIKDLQSQKKAAMRYGDVHDEDLKNDKYLKQNETYNNHIEEQLKKLRKKQKDLEDIQSDDKLTEEDREKKVKTTQKEIDAINQEIDRYQILIDNRVKLMELHKQEKEESKQTPEEKALLATEKLVGMKQSLAQAEEKVAARKADYEAAKGTENEIKMLEALDNQIKKRDKIQEQIANTEQKIERLGQVTQKAEETQDEVASTVGGIASSEISGGLLGLIKEAVGEVSAVDLTNVEEILSKILEILDTFKTEGIKKSDTKNTSEEKSKQPKKTEADLIRDGALKQHDVVKGLAAGRGSLYNQYTKDVEELNKAVEEANAASEKDKKKAIAKVKTKAQKVSTLSYNILKNTSQWDYLVANSDSGAKNLYLKQGESLKDKMELMAKKEHGILGKRGGKLTNPKYQYDFLGFDGDTLTYQLTDIEGKTRKVTMVWNEFNKQVAMTSDKTGSKLSELAGKIESFGEKFKDAIDSGYLGAKDKDLQKFQDAITKINTEIANGASFTKVDKLRNEALRVADEVNKKVAKNKRAYSGTTEINAVNRQRDNLSARNILDKTDIAMVEQYNKQYEELIKKHNQFKTNGTLFDPKNQQTLQGMAIKVRDLGKQLDKSITEAEQLEQLVNNSGTYQGKQMGGIKQLAPEEASNLEASMKSYLKTLGFANAEHIKYDHTHQRLTATQRISSHAVADLEMKYNKATGALYAYQKQERESLTGLPAFLNGFQKKFNSIMQYLTMTMSIHQVLAQLRRGVQYIKEIDLALVELRKVTDETDETYEKFLQTAAKTGERLGSTISAVTEATATFAKLGYSMSQATEMAEAAIVYKNVGDNIASTEDAADSIISTMKGFGLEASESMAIVDRFNEIGNRFAITSQGIGEALRLSASALNEGKNSLDESIALITAANEVVNDPSSVGTALKTLTLRLRGSKTELEEMGEDVTDMATTTSQLQAKLLALTGGKVDIMLDANTFKNTTQILREMADAWEDMNDISRASALELMGGRLLPLYIEICA